MKEKMKENVRTKETKDKEEGKMREGRGVGKTRSKKRKQLDQKREMSGKEKKNKKQDKEEQIKARQQKCSFTAFWRLMKENRHKIPEQAWQILRSTNFWPMIEPFYGDKITMQQLTKNEVDLEIMLKYFDKNKKKFVFGDLELEITEDDVEAIFGIPNQGKELELEKLKKKIHKLTRVFKNAANKDSVLKTEVEMALRKELMKKKHEDPEEDEDKDIILDEDKKKEYQDPKTIAPLVILCLFTSFLFSRSGTNVNWDLIQVCADIDNINQYNWSRYVLEFLLQGLQKHNKKKPTTLSGCLVLIYYWFLEKSKLKSWIPLKGTEKPHFIRWSIKEIFDIEELNKSPDWLERVMKEGPWSEAGEEEESPKCINFSEMRNKLKDDGGRILTSSNRIHISDNLSRVDNLKKEATDLEAEIQEREAAAVLASIWSCGWPQREGVL